MDKPAKYSVNLALGLGIPPKNIFKFMKVVLGNKVASGDVLAEKKGFFKSKKVFSQQSGKAVALKESGELVIELDQPESANNLKNDKTDKQCKINDTRGRLVLLPDGRGLDILDSSLSNKIVVIFSKISSIFYYKAKALGIKKLVVMDQGQKTDKKGFIFVPDQQKYTKNRLSSWEGKVVAIKDGVLKPDETENH